MSLLFLYGSFILLFYYYRLKGVALEYGKEGAATTTLVTGAVERCVCPIGEWGRWGWGQLEEKKRNCIRERERERGREREGGFTIMTSVVAHHRK